MMTRCCGWLLLCTLACGAAGCSRPDADAAQAARASLPQAKIPVVLAPAVRADMVARVELVGSLIPTRRTVIVSEVDGVIIDIPVSEDDRVEVEFNGQQFSEAPRLDIGVEVAKEDVLVLLDPREYELKLRAADARYNVAKRELEKLAAWRRSEEVRRAEAARDEAKARLALAESQLKRLTTLLEDQAVSKGEFDQAEAERKSAEAALARAQADLDLAQAGPTKEDIAVAQAAIAQAQAEVEQAQWELDRTKIKAPYDGVVTDRFVDVGDRLTAMPRVEVMELMDLSLLTAYLGVPERYVGRIQVGDMAQVQVKGTIEPVPGIVALINDKVDSANRAFRIKVAIRNEGRQFKAGQFVNVSLPVESSPNTLSVPAEAISYAGGEARVFVHHDGVVHPRAVEIGVSNEEHVEVLSGLTEGEQVVVDDPSILSDGMAVELRSANDASLTKES
jgi:multidrug efflux pump subunit AcrA (membrane-fusion protein)